ncbi:DUF554 domain-containing protein [Pectinatus frisingensis]|uniref:DUF554 domain-containing protein n=1 Tax=Pectinatus frisingensis TaxID=865 RepID=UPI0018C4F149
MNDILTGTVVNTAAVVGGGLVGLVIKKGLPLKLQEILLQALGVATLFIGLTGVLSKQLVIKSGQLQSDGIMLMVASLIIGTVIGEIIDIEHDLGLLGDKAKKILKMDENDKFSEAFVTATVVICVGAMAIIGSFEDGINGNSTILFTKSILDGVLVMIFASTMGSGAVFSAGPLFLYQGGLSLAAASIAPYLTSQMMNGMSAVGSVLIFVIGVNLMLGKIIHIRVGNMLPAIIVPLLYYAVN